MWFVENSGFFTGSRATVPLHGLMNDDDWRISRKCWLLGTLWLFSWMLGGFAWRHALRFFSSAKFHVNLEMISYFTVDTSRCQSSTVEQAALRKQLLKKWRYTEPVCLTQICICLFEHISYLVKKVERQQLYANNHRTPTLQWLDQVCVCVCVRLNRFFPS